MKLVIDANIPAAEHCFGHFGTLTRVPGREINAAHLRDADALIVRSITQVNDQLLADSPVRFIGTCTIGTDHIDQAALAQRNIAFASAPGCNAEAVVDYVLSSLLTLAERDGWPLGERTVGIVGVGNVGSRLQARLTAMGVATLACDPPRADEEGQTGFHSLDALIERCDVLCLHTPLTREGAHATYQLLNAQRIDELAPGSVLLNAGRGDCVDGLALRSRLSGKGDIKAVLDVWEEEPDIDAGLRDLVSIATPHIAGHSLDGKLRGTWMIQQALARHCGQPSEFTFADICPPPALASLHLQHALPPEDALRLCMRAVYDVRRDHDALQRQTLHHGMHKGFDDCRANYPLRREFSTLSVQLSGEAVALEGLLRGAGVTVTEQDSKK
ncbi:4-phosphoerythronate dehydrogenase PdxB [Halomonas sp. HAL1]|uniref:4-phosphoerythronate dehydrogenase PdxB n=1 Tax=Halomonas sp. HAL1 TaxID=550984 RepID=UPI00022D2B1C|nr:4-phosphoerythronate dehydrogenase PdxB [Halomonas sp. HAL1]EHA15174.1 erythronate-4-phosphate dehydrogenase [Halomonas sp. HAL1]WKV94151.1 4-phosphoerythronate dehydrogenase PdxB [Halomonas sp. HAL1]